MNTFHFYFIIAVFILTLLSFYIYYLFTIHYGEMKFTCIQFIQIKLISSKPDAFHDMTHISCTFGGGELLMEFICQQNWREGY